MTQTQTAILIGSGLAALAAFLVGWPRLTDRQRSTTIDLVNVGLVSTLIGVPIGLYLLDHYPDSLIPAAGLTAAGFATKSILLPHAG